MPSTDSELATEQLMAALQEKQRRQELLSRDDIERDYRGITRRWLELAALWQ